MTPTVDSTENRTDLDAIRSLMARSVELQEEGAKHGEALAPLAARRTHSTKRPAAPAAPVPRVVDTTGAGDLFAGGFLYGFTRGKDIAHCAKLGALCAAEIISHFGARPETKLNDLAAKAGLA